MSLWLLIVLLGVIKLPLAALMLWLPFREDEAMLALEDGGSSEEDGGSRTRPVGPRSPHPRLPQSPRPPARRRGHGTTGLIYRHTGRRGAHARSLSPAPPRTRRRSSAPAR